jgi:hypothetical protein
MTFYQARYHDGTFGELRDTRDEAQRDLAKAGYEICGLREDNGILHDPNRNICVAIITI